MCVVYTVTVEVAKEHRYREFCIVIIQIFTQIIYSVYRLLMTSVESKVKTDIHRSFVSDYCYD